MQRIKGFLEWIPAVAIACMVGVVVYIIAAPSGDNKQSCKGCLPTPEAFAPIKISPFKLVTEGPYHVGQTVTMQNGICNTTTEDIPVSVVLGVREEKDPLVAKNVIVLPQSGVGMSMFPIAPGCIPNSDKLTGPLPPSVGPGRWRVYLILTATGVDGRRQMLTMQSDVFEVIP